jgi:hypothetical protein
MYKLSAANTDIINNKNMPEFKLIHKDSLELNIQDLENP